MWIELALSFHFIPNRYFLLALPLSVFLPCHPSHPSFLPAFLLSRCSNLENSPVFIHSLLILHTVSLFSIPHTLPPFSSSISLPLLSSPFLSSHALLLFSSPLSLYPIFLYPIFLLSYLPSLLCFPFFLLCYASLSPLISSLTLKYMTPFALQYHRIHYSALWQLCIRYSTMLTIPDI